MSENIIKCPKCGAEIPLTEALTGQIEEKIRQQCQTQLDEDRKKLQDEAAKQASDKLYRELADLKEQLQSKTKTLDEAQKNELELRKQKRELEEHQKTIDLEVARKIDAERKQIQDATQKQIVDEFRQKDLEKDKTISDLTRLVEEMRRKAEQGSMQTQGEVMELELEAILNSTFPMDQIEPVAKGIKGADSLQHVRDGLGRNCGIIIWESKQTKNWSNDWIEKLKEDQRQAKAEIAVIRSAALPKDIKRFGMTDGVWVTDHDSAMPLAAALRISLISVAQARLTQEDKQGKMEVLYSYLTGQEFKQRVEAIIESFDQMKRDLDAEKKAMAGIWAKREKQMEQVVGNLVGMRGDMEGIVGNVMPQIEALDLKKIGE